MKKIFFFLAAMVLSIAAQAAVHYPTSGGEKQLRDAVRDLAQPGDTIVLADGVYAEPSDIAIEKEGLVIMAAEGAKPVVAIKGWATIQAKASFTVNGITFDGMDDAYYFIAIKGTGLYDITLKNCEFTGWKQWAISNQYDAEFTVGKVLVDNCLFHDAPNSAIRFSGDAPEGMHACQHLEVTNSTFSNIGNTSDAYGTVCAISNTNAAGVENEVVVDHCTFYNCLAKSTDHAGIYVYGAKGENVQISNNILALAEAGDKPRAIYSAEDITASNCLTYNYTKDGTGIRSTVTAVNCIHKDPLFVDAVNSNFNLQPGSPAISAATDGTNLGDPRWKVAAAELAFAMAAPAADVEATDLYTIKWTVLDPDGDATIKLEYKAEEGEWTLIEENIPTTKSAYDWNIRKMAAQIVAIRGTLTNATETIESVAAGNLTIVPETVAPRPVRELTGVVEESALTLTWINPDQPFSTTTAIETLEQAVADGTAELTFSEDKKEVTAAYTTEAAWVQAGLKLPMNLEYVNSLNCQLKRDTADGTQIMITIEQNSYDWWYLIETGITTEWTDFSFTEFEKLGWHNESDATVLDGTNVTAIYISTNDGSPRTGSVSLRNLVVTGNAPAVADYEKTVVCVSEVAYPTTIVAEEVVYEGAASTCTLNIDPTKDLYVSVFAQDDLGNTSVAAQYMYEAPEVVEPEKPEPTYTENKLNTYAFGLESELNDTALVVTYRLNNSNATSVNVLVYKGENVVATVAGTTTIGVNTVVIPVATLPQGRMLTWSVEVNGTSVEVPTQEEKNYGFYCPHGLAIDTNPESENFGRILVAEAMHGNIGTKSYVSHNAEGVQQAGLYTFNPSFTTDSTVYTGGNDFTRILASNGYQPWRVKISEDGRIFVSSLDLNGVVVWEVSKDLQTWTPVIAGTNDATDHNIYDADSNFVAGLNCSMDVTGSGENLKLLLYSTNNKGIAFNQSGYRLDEYALGTATTWTGTPTNIINGGAYGVVHTNVEFIYDGEGGYWFGGSRAGNAGQPNLVHINAAGEQDYYTEDASLYGGDGVLVHNGMLFKGKARTSGTVGNFGVWTIGKDADGKVTLTEKWSVVANGIGRNLNEFAVDYAENLYVVGNSGEMIIAYALPYSGQVVTPAASKYAFHIGELLPDPAVVTEMVGVVKRAIQNGESTIVLTHETDGTPHIYEVTDGTILELLQNGVIARDPENAGDLLAISDIAVTEDGKLIANNYMITQSGDDQVVAGDKRGETRIYIWNDLHDAPSILFTSKMSSNWYQSKQGLTMAVKGTSDNMEIFMTGIHKSKAWARASSYRVIDGVYTEPEVNHNDHYYFYDINDAIALETTVGTQYELNASPLGEMNWILDAELINPVEIVESSTNNVEIATSVALTEDLGKKYNGASYVTVGEQVLMVAPFATPDGKLNSVMILDITAGFDAPKYVDQLILEEAVEATAAATAVEVVEGDEANALLITLVADATIYSLEATLAKGDNWEVYEDEITNLVIDLDNLTLIGGPSSAFQVDVFLGLGEYNRNDDTYQLLPESSIAVMGSDATFIEGYAYEVDAFTPSAKAVVRCEWKGMNIEFHLTMTAEPMEATKVVVENATIEIEKYQIFGDMYDYALTMTGNWINPEDGLTYPVLVEVPVYYPEATEPSEIMSTVTVGGRGDDDPWLGFGEGTLTVTTVGDVITATGIVQNPMAGVAIDITISGSKTPTAIDNATITVRPVKVIKNGQLIIINNDVEYSAQGQVIK